MVLSNGKMEALTKEIIKTIRSMGWVGIYQRIRNFSKAYGIVDKDTEKENFIILMVQC